MTIRSRGTKRRDARGAGPAAQPIPRRQRIALDTPLYQLFEISVTGCPPPGVLDAPDWVLVEVKCRDCGTRHGTGKLRGGWARVTFTCRKCRRKTERRFPPDTCPGPGTVGGDPIAGTQLPRCALDHDPMASVEQGPYGVESVWWLHCPGCARETRWP